MTFHRSASDDDAASIIDSWLWALQAIPTESLDYCFLRALQTRKEAEFPPTAGEVIQAWREWQEELQDAEERRRLRMCHDCSGTRKITFYNRELGHDVTIDCPNPVHKREDDEAA